MINALLSKTKNLNKIIQNCTSENAVFDKVLENLKMLSNSNIILVDKNGKVIEEKLVDDISIFNKKSLNDNIYIETQLNDQFKNILETKVNVTLENFCLENSPEINLKLYTGILVPINVISERLGILILYSTINSFNKETLILSEYVSSIIGLILLHSQSEETAEESRKMSVVKSAIGTLSYSELEAILHIFKELDGNEGLLVASKVADKVGITRSVIVNALRKFESAGVIESRSLGMKGTFIKVLNKHLIDELNKLRK